MRRRTLVAGLLVAATTARAQAQQTGKVYRLALVHSTERVLGMREHYQALFDRLHELGYVEGRNLVVELYSAEGQVGRYAELARDVVGRKPDVIYAGTVPMVQQFKAATSTLPIVGGMSDPIGFGLVANLARPGGNITGISVDAGGPILGKRLELLRGVVPTATRVGFLVPRLPESSPPEVAIRESTGRMGITLLAPRLEGDITETEYRRFFAAMAEQRAEGLIVSEHSDNFTYRRLVVGLAAEARLPAIYGNREHAVMGGLMAYTVPFAGLYRHAADQIDQILRGTNPGDIPIYQASRFELVINLTWDLLCQGVFSLMRSFLSVPGFVVGSSF